MKRLHKKKNKKEEEFDEMEPKISNHSKRGQKSKSRPMEWRIATITSPSTQKFLKTFAHHTASNINLNPTLDIGIDDNVPRLEKLFKFFTPFPFKSTFPLPVLDATHTPTEVAAGRNPVTSLVERKFHCNTKLVNILNCCSKKLQQSFAQVADELAPKYKRMEAKHFRKPEVIPYIWYRVTSTLHDDTDDSFKSAYNWYHTGGNVATMALKGRTILLAARGENSHELHANAVKRASFAASGYRVKESACAVRVMKDSTPIFQIEASEHGDTGSVATRQKQKCCVYVCGRDPSSSMDLVHQSVSDTPFTSIALSPTCQTQLCTTNQDRKLLLWDILKNKKEHIKMDKPTSGELQWCGVHYSLTSPNRVYFSDHEMIRIIDLRILKSTPSILFQLSGVQDLVDMCEQITVAASSTVSPHIQYVGTSHQLLSIDVRKPLKPLQRWTHLLNGFPQFISLFCDIPGREVICLAGTRKSDLHAIVNEWSDDNVNNLPVSRTQPYLLDGISTTLNKAKKQGLCLNPVVQFRLKLGLTGISSICCSHPAIFTATCAGDVFCQRISPRFEPNKKEYQEEEVFNSKMTFWEKKVKNLDLEQKLPVFYQADQVDVSSICSQMITKTTPNEAPETEARYSTAPNWEMSEAELFKSQDIFAPRILETWGITNCEKWRQERNRAYGIPSKPPDRPMQRVQEWLTHTSTSQPVPEDIFPSFSQQNASQSSTWGEELMSASQQPTNPTPMLKTAPCNQESIVQLGGDSKSVRSSKVSKSGQKRKRTDGF